MTSKLEIEQLRMEVQVLRAELAKANYATRRAVEEKDALRPAAEALKTAVELNLRIGMEVQVLRAELAKANYATRRAAEAVKENGK